METKETPRIRTYERDVEEFMKQEGGTVAKFALAEQERRIEKTETGNIPRPTGTPFQGGTLKNPSLEGGAATKVVAEDVNIPSQIDARHFASARSLALWGIVFLLLAGAIGIGYWYFSNLPASPKSAPRVTGTAKIILADKEKMLDTTRLARDTFITAFARERSAALALSSFTLIVPAKAIQGADGEAAVQALAASEFLSLISAGVEGGFVRALEPHFALGLRGLPTNRAFLIFKTNYYQTALAGMLKWEKNMLGDIGPLFGEAIGGVNFTDRTIRNRDVRELLGTDGKPLLLYGFADKKTLIVTNDGDSFEKIMGKLVAAPQ